MLKVELKKFFKPILLVVVVLLSIVFYQLQLSFLYNGLPNGIQVQLYDYVYKWHDAFGNTMTDGDFEKVEREYQELRKEADKFISTSEYGQKNKLKSYADFEKWQDTLPKGVIYDMSVKDQQKMKEFSQFHTNNLFFQLEAYEMIKEGLERFTSEEAFFDQRPSSSEKRALVQQVVFKEESWRNILPEGLPGTVASHISDILILAMISMVLLLPSAFVKDNLLKLKAMQWSSRKGRSLINTQFLAIQLGAFMMVTLFLLLFLLPITGTKFAEFFNSGLNSFFTESFSDAEYSFFHITFGQWILLLVLLVYLLGLSFANILFLVAQSSHNYLAMLMKIIPLLTLFIMLDIFVVKSAFYIQNILYRKTEILNIELYVATCIFIFSTGCSVIYIRSMKHKDLNS